MRTLVGGCVCCSRKQQSCQNAPVISSHTLGKQSRCKPQRNEQANHSIDSGQRCEEQARLRFVRQIAKVGLDFRGAEGVGHGTVRQDTCCRAVSQLLAGALAFGVQKTATSGRHGLEEAVELARSALLIERARSTHTTWRKISYCQSSFSDIESSNMASEKARGEQYNTKETHGDPSPGEACVARVPNRPYVPM